MARAFVIVIIAAVLLAAAGAAIDALVPQSDWEPSHAAEGDTSWNSRR